MAAKNSGGRGRLRIIAGRWRGRKLDFPDRPTLRPTPDRVRETLFNWLQAEISGSQCLDLFAGSGALGFEAASRGARHVTLVERDSEALSALSANVSLLAAAQQMDVVAADAQQYLQQPAQAYDIVFLDPPYQAGLLAACSQLLENGQWLSNHAKIYLESESGKDLEGLPQNWQCLKHKQAGQVAYRLFARTSCAEPA